MDVLVVEDEFLLALALEDCLTRAGHRVIGPVRRRAEALAHAVRARPDVALVDICLADGDCGLDVAADLEEEVGVPVLYASGQVEDARASGSGLGVLGKPFDERALLQSLDVVAELRRGRRPAALPAGLTLFADDHGGDADDDGADRAAGGDGRRVPAAVPPTGSG